jgi:hypothetical protein
VRRALRDSYGHWIREVGVDAFRVDTAFYVPPDYFDDFLHARTTGARRASSTVARAPGGTTSTFGEGFGIDPPFQDGQARKIEPTCAQMAGRPAAAAGMLNFPLYGRLGDVFARGRPTAVLGHRIQAMMRVARATRTAWRPSSTTTMSTASSPAAARPG